MDKVEDIEKKYDGIINEWVGELMHTDVSPNVCWNLFTTKTLKILSEYPELEEFLKRIMSVINSEYLYEYLADDTLRNARARVLQEWKYYKQQGGLDNMGINMKENESEGSAFEQALGFHVEDKDDDDKLKPLPESNGEYQKYLDEAIAPTYENKKRVSKTDYYLGIAKAVAVRGTCMRRKFGAIIVKDDRIVSTGYVGAPRGRKNCTDIGTCFRQENNIPSGQRYELCRSVHAEMNAIISASKEELEGGVMYLAGIENDGSVTPHADCCAMCKRVIINAGIRYVVIAKPGGGSTKVPVETWVQNDDSLALHEGY